MNKYFEKFSEVKALVIGDIMLDKYYFSDVERISPEAPIPVARFNREESFLGGASNVALNLARLGIQTGILGQVGKDENSTVIKNLLKKENVSFFPVEVSNSTISKIRIISKSYQLLRLDFEEKNLTIDSNLVIESIKKIIPNYDLIIVSDYQKGLLSHDVIEYLKTLDKYISIDTKPGTFVDFEGFNLLKPNFKEAVGIANSLGNVENFENSNEDVEKLGKFLKQKLKTNLLITRSERGVSYIGEKVEHHGVVSSKIVDVTGAGDTSIAIFSVLDFLGCEKDLALEIMNAAARVTVSNLGTYAPVISEISSELYLEDFENVIPFEKIEDVSKILKSEDKKIVFTNGCFDLLHEAHVNFLINAKKEGDILIVGVNSDSSIKKLKGENRPIIDEASRAFILSNLKCVDYVVIFEQDNPIELIKKIKPDVHVKDSGYKIEDVVEAPTVEKLGGKVVILKRGKKSSTTSILEKIRNG